ncbi:MAG TPA: hypothetical protein VF920_08570, partial [Dongiaceae bacterium]
HHILFSPGSGGFGSWSTSLPPSDYLAGGLPCSGKTLGTALLHVMSSIDLETHFVKGLFRSRYHGTAMRRGTKFLKEVPHLPCIGPVKAMDVAATSGGSITLTNQLSS